VAARSVPGSPPRQLVVPDLFAVLPAGITTAQVSAISGLTGVRAVLAVDGGQVVINGRRIRAGIPVNDRNRMVPMRLWTGRLLAACVVGAGSLAWALAGGMSGIAPAFALDASAASSQCEPLPAASAASPSPSSSPAELCVSVQESQSGINRGQAASFTVQVSSQNGPASGVSVTLAAAPQGQAAQFTARCPGGNGSATCTIGSLDTSLSPTAYQMQAQIAVAASASSVTSVTLTATADAATSPAMTALPAASQTVAVAAPASASASPAKTAASTAPASTPVAQVSPASTPGLATVLPPVPLPQTPAGGSTTLFSPASVASVLPEITPVPVPSPATGNPASPVADTSAPAAGSFTLALNMSAATAQAFGLIVVALTLTLAATKLVADHFTARRNTNAKASKKPADGKGGTAARPGFLRRPRQQGGPRRRPPASRQQVPERLPDNTA